ncbi:hypothetical protein [Neobacillus mesonae]|uniref:hypothetical protein n=1 Tax=Neobacillus mesonae TaxID=1193713 RepID=UPI00203D28F0|nr:hypothetical protein [Neobacillus mesonae]MCM3569578.1 hypothetical protein [Neobacillus mesonae]
MFGTWKLNAFLGFIAFIFSFILSMENNTWLTSLFRALTGFAIFFVLSYFVRWMLHQMDLNKNAENQNGPSSSKVKRQQSSKTEKQQPVKPSAFTEENSTAGSGTTDDSAFQAISLNALHNRKDENLPQ